MKRLLLILVALASVALANDAQGQIGWTLDQCRKHWGRETISHLGEEKGSGDVSSKSGAPSCFVGDRTNEEHRSQNGCRIGFWHHGNVTVAVAGVAVHSDDIQSLNRGAATDKDVGHGFGK
jgi:hypothetical protein